MQNLWIRFRTFIILSFPLLVTILFSFSLQIYVLSNREYISKLLEGFGVYIIFAYVLLQPLTIIIAPIGGSFMQLTILALYGPELALPFIYIVSTPVFVINFLIARRYGRPLVERLVGKESLQKMDHVISDAGVFSLMIFKVLQGGNFDYIAYAYGLSKMQLRTFILVNIIGGIPGTIISYFIFRNPETFTRNVIYYQLFTALLTILSILINHYIRKK